VLGQALVEESVVAVQKIDDAAILMDHAADEHFRFLAQRGREGRLSIPNTGEQSGDREEGLEKRPQA
jgi:hypothetical protein